MNLFAEHAKPLDETLMKRCQAHSSMTKESIGSQIVEGMPYSQCVSYVSISHVNLEKVFSSIFALLPNLQGANFYKSHLLSLEGVGQAKNLRTLVVDCNEISELPPELVNLKEKLWMLMINDNPIRELPDFVLQLSKLRYLSIGYTLITELPENIGQLKRLKQLDVTNTGIVRLPDSVSELKVWHQC